MKRVFCLFFIALMIVSFSACHYSESGDILEPVEFFYPRNTENFIYGSSDGVITAEIREASGHIGDLNYLLSMYLRGPQDASLRSPFPSGCRLEEIRAEENTLHVCLSREFSVLEGADLTLACVALAKTCLSMTDYVYICIDATSANRTVSMVLDAESMLLADHSAFNSAPTAE